MTWSDNRNGTYDIFAQRVNASGDAQWTIGGIPICTAGQTQAYPQICFDGVGGAIITWEDYRTGEWDVYVQRVNAEGTVQWAVNGVTICAATGTQRLPKICSDGLGGAIIAWTDHRTSNSDIYVQRVDPSGAQHWGADGLRLTSEPELQENPELCSDGLGGAIVAWNDYRSGFEYDVYARRVDSSGTALWAVDGISICTATNNQVDPRLCSDGTGGAIIAWHDERAGAADIYAQRVTASGSKLWTANGAPICTASNTQSSHKICEDAAGGAIITWRDERNSSEDIFAQRVNPYGVAQWTSNGTAISTAAEMQSDPRLCVDGTGGAIISWFDYRNDNGDIYAQKISATGVVQWTTNGNPISAVSGNQQTQRICSDGAGGAIVVWWDTRYGNDDIFAQNRDRYGYLGCMAPALANVQDVINDQGGKVSLLWNHSPLDSWSDQTVTSYRIYRGIRSTVALSSYTILSENEYSAKESRMTEIPRTYMLLEQAVASSEPIYWEGIANFTAEGLESYNYAAPTLSDSGPQGNSINYFMIRAKTSNPAVYWDSQPDSGYSVDNLPPATPGGESLTPLAANSIHLGWEPNTEDPDVAYYVVYRSSSSGFAPSPASLLATTADTGYVDNTAMSGSTYYYRLTAVDIHGNQSTPTEELSLSFTRSLAAGWNMVSLPGSMPDAYYLTAYPGATSGTLYGFDGAYVSADTLHAGEGYWLKYPAATNVTTNSATVSSRAIALNSGWNMIGGPSCAAATSSISDPSHVIVPGTFYDYDHGYNPITALQRGRGYWVRASGAGTITLACSGSPKQTGPVVLADLSSFPSLTVCDAAGGKQTLYYNLTLSNPQEQLSYSLPPLPAEECFDVRWAGDYRAVQAGGGTIQIRSINYPITITAANVPSNADDQYVLVETTKENACEEHVLVSGVPIEVHNPKVNKLVLRKESSVPLVFALQQNYPNPFNPKTEIRYTVPGARGQEPGFSIVKMMIYDLLGRDVVTLVNEEQKPGVYTVTFDATALASGVYIYQLTVENRTDVKRMVCIK